MGTWLPISQVPHEDGEQVHLWTQFARVSVWAWSEARQRWERDGADGIHWAEGDEYGPTHFCPLMKEPGAASSKQFFVYQHAAEQAA